MKHFLPAFRMLLFMTLLTGLAYPALVTGLGQAFFGAQAAGRPSLIAQKFESDRYFWPRPSAVDYNPLPSGGSNLGPTSAELKRVVAERAAHLKAKHAGPPPQDLLFASGSGLDPEISPAAAEYQIARVARARGLSDSALRQVVLDLTEGRQFGILGEPRVNVLKLNLALDHGE